MPLGNFNCSWLIIWRFIGMARNTPSAAVNRTHGATTYQRWWPPSISNSAPKAVPTVTPVDDPAAAAVDCMQLFSRMVIWVSLPPVSARKEFQMTKESTQAVMDTPKDQPSLSV